MDIKVDPEIVVEVVKEAFWLAYQACGSSAGMGFLQARAGVTKDQVWDNVQNDGDYQGAGHSKPGKPFGDCVFGRMMKLSINFDPKTGVIEVSDGKPSIDYQAWCHEYPTRESLVLAAADNVKELGREAKILAARDSRARTSAAADNVDKKEEDDR